MQQLYPSARKVQKLDEHKPYVGVSIRTKDPKARLRLYQDSYKGRYQDLVQRAKSMYPVPEFSNISSCIQQHIKKSSIVTHFDIKEAFQSFDYKLLFHVDPVIAQFITHRQYIFEDRCYELKKGLVVGNIIDKCVFQHISNLIADDIKSELHDDVLVFVDDFYIIQGPRNPKIELTINKVKAIFKKYGFQTNENKTYIVTNIYSQQKHYLTADED